MIKEVDEVSIRGRKDEKEGSDRNGPIGVARSEEGQKGLLWVGVTNKR